MRRILTLLTLLLLLTNVAVAQEQSGDGSVQTPIYSHVPSNYCIIIPSTVRADGTNYEITAKYLDLCPGDTVLVNVYGIGEDGYVSLNTEDGKSMKALFGTIYGENSSDGMQVAEFSKDGVVGGQFYLSPREWQGAGNYYGQLTFDISLREEYVFGY